MSRLFYHVMQDNVGNLLFDVSGTMRIAGTGTLATIYGDEALTVILPNPMTNHASYGSFKCFLGAGDYDFYMAKSGYSFETLTGVQGHGTMAQENANAVSALGVVGTTHLQGAVGIGTAPAAPNALVVAANSVLTPYVGIGITPFYPFHVNGLARFDQPVAIGATSPGLGVQLGLAYDRSAGQCIQIRPTADTGPGAAVQFCNAAVGTVGTIVTNGTTTTYNTTSDARLKHDVAPLDGALDVLRALNPVSFLWKADGSPGRGFLAHEVAAVVDGVIAGERDAVDEAGQVLPQQIDHSKLVPWLVAAVKELTAQVEMLTAKLAGAGA